MSAGVAPNVAVDPATFSAFLSLRSRYTRHASTFASSDVYLDNLADEAAAFRLLFGEDRYWASPRFRACCAAEAALSRRRRRRA